MTTVDTAGAVDHFRHTSFRIRLIDTMLAHIIAGHTAHTLVIVDNSVVVHDRYCAFRTCSFTFSAGDAAVAAGLSYDFVILFC